jgi:HipA-like protein
MLPSHHALRVLSVNKRGSSAPVVVETAAGRFVVKLRGAAQGLPPLVAEIIVAELASALGLPVPERALVTLDEHVPSDDKNDELADLLARSRGMNLGFRELRAARDLRLDQLQRIERDVAAQILWLDGLVMNPDRTAQNPNILLWNERPWLIDHGACLAFHYDWQHVTEASPREPGPALHQHLLFARALPLAEIDADAARALPREVLRAACACVPAEFLASAFPDQDPERTRAAYVAFLWKRLKPPRPFVPAAPTRAS